MKYIIMCGGKYRQWDTPRHLTSIDGEPLIARTIRQLRENGVEDIAISSDNPVFEQFGVPVLRHENSYKAYGYDDYEGYWCDAFYPTEEPTCYIFGDVIFSPRAIKRIVEYKGSDIMLFGSKPPFAKNYPKKWVEPFAFKVWDMEHLKRACELVKILDKEGMFDRKPIAWETWNVICGGDPNKVDYKSYIAINDYTCDIDNPSEVERIDTRHHSV